MGAQSSRQRAVKRTRLTALALSGTFCIALSVCYATQPDSCAGVTVWPAWGWAWSGITLLAVGSSAATRRGALVAGLLWLSYLALFADEPRSLMRFPRLSEAELQAARVSGKAPRVISLNCMGGSPEAAAEARQYQPDIVLLQESPTETQVRELAQELFGDDGTFVCNPDASVIARGEICSRSHQAHPHIAQADISLPSGVELHAFSIRLWPAIFRLDIWSPSYWREQTANRRLHREQMQDVVTLVDDIPDGTPIVLGGDFNAPATDAVVRFLRPRLHDAFREGGVGWGNTVLNDFPILRFDQAWASHDFRSVQVRAVKTRHSDHRMVVCDFLLCQQTAR